MPKTFPCSMSGGPMELRSGAALSLRGPGGCGFRCRASGNYVSEQDTTSRRHMKTIGVSLRSGAIRQHWLHAGLVDVAVVAAALPGCRQETPMGTAPARVSRVPAAVVPEAPGVPEGERRAEPQDAGADAAAEGTRAARVLGSRPGKLDQPHHSLRQLARDVDVPITHVHRRRESRSRPGARR